MLKLIPIAAIAALLLGCAELPEPPRVREFTTRQALEVLGVTSKSGFQELGARRPVLLPLFKEAASIIRASEAVAKGATAQGVTVFVIDDFSAWKFKDGRFHGDYVSAIIKLTAPQATVLTCDAWKHDLGHCLFDANALARQGKIQVVNMSLGIVGTYCEFGGDLADEDELEQHYVPDKNEFYFPQKLLSPDQADALEHWVRDLRAKHGVAVVSSAGNDGYRIGAKAPGCWSSLRVGATYDIAFRYYEWSKCRDDNVMADDRVCWSNYGNVFAPGARIDNVFADAISFNGTSASAPFASAVTALVIGTRELKGEAAALKVLETAVPIRDIRKTGLAHKRLDAVLATGVGGPLPPAQSLYKFLDKNQNCVLDDDELLVGIGLWISGAEWAPQKRISDAEIIDLLGKWIGATKLC